MLSRLKTRMLGLSAIAIVSLGAISYDNAQLVLAEHKNCGCNTTLQTTNQNTLICKREAHTSWYAWLTGESSSAQFHYLDLLELLLGSKQSSDNSNRLTSHL
ncbi:hypothetical protein J8L98_19435 [Pseudoalteromonas sp. MMG013]|uniref:Secreted protein n=1 Tax=Pseudoalteromonas aurantia 208 TaxID=1314867 RepID=A0ABR9E6F1_9GAMM|nr:MULTISPECIES: hypothetical protein [Pseudoalteromonas]MBE0366565.1 hypothetical protein [Pseudoalteromonas aurantia 208]MBQ4850508.1 hypothetical protein [Pseudoalteromonas sp. MMG012]MBQ4863862.1 hypothetical protein [Pseudoalteromonas sp. MMG013]